MKLSDAIILGDTLKTAKPNMWLSPDGSCGCAFGGALLAAGVKPERFWSECGQANYGEVVDAPCVQELWPWIEFGHLLKISSMYWDKHNGMCSIEDIAAYVRTIEPQEQEQEISKREKVIA